MASIIYKLSNKVGEDKRSQIIIWFKISSTKRVQVQTGIFISPKYFQVTSENGGAKLGHIKVPNRSKLNFAEVKEMNDAKARLQMFASKLLRLYEVMPTEELTKDFFNDAVKVFDKLDVQDITEKSVREALASLNDEAIEVRKGFFEYFETYIQENNFSNSRTRSFYVLMRTLHRWQEYRNAINKKEHFTIELDTLTADDVQDFREYVRNEYDLQNEKGNEKLFERLLTKYPVEITPKHKHAKVEQKGENAITYIIKIFKTYWLWLMTQKGATKNNPFIGVKVGKSIYGVPYYLTIEERNKVADFDLSKRPMLAIQRDIFIFQCLVGCRVSDLYKFTDANITDGILEYVPTKTQDNDEQVKPRVPLNKRALSLIERYRGIDKQGRLFPYISTQKYNDAIKEILELCEIKRNVPVRNTLTGETEMKPIYSVASSHMARRTFVGSAYSKVQDPNLIGKMSGHVEGSRAFVRYRAINDEMLKDVINKID